MNVCTSYGLVQVACWATQYAQYQDYIKKGKTLAIMCRKQDENYSVKEIKTLEQWRVVMNIN